MTEATSDKPKPGATVYVLTEGCYSDHHVVAVFSTREAVEAFMERAKVANEWNDYAFDEYTLDDYATMTVSRYWECIIRLEDGVICDELAHHGRTEHRIGERGTVEVDSDKAWAKSYVSAEHARKLAVEARQKWLREKEGV